MASNSRASCPSAGGSSASSASSISVAAAAMARGRARAGASAGGLMPRGVPLFDVAQGGARRPFHDRLHLGLGLGQLRFAVAPERGAALVVGDGLGERALAAFERLHDLLQLLQ